MLTWWVAGDPAKAGGAAVVPSVVPVTTVGAARCGPVSVPTKAPDAVPRRVVPTAHPTEILLPSALALVVAKRLAPKAADGLRNKLPGGELTPAAEVERGGNRSPQRQHDLAGGEAASVSGVVGAPISCHDSWVLQHRVQGQGCGESLEDTLASALLRQQDEASRLPGCDLLQGSGGAPVGSTDEKVPRAGDIHPEKEVKLLLNPLYHAERILKVLVVTNSPKLWSTGDVRSHGAVPLLTTFVPHRNKAVVLSG